eukprot:COSAG03_NODE_1899_length_3378_cov_1.854834_3_plen_332_part_00
MEEEARSVGVSAAELPESWAAELEQPDRRRGVDRQPEVGPEEQEEKTAQERMVGAHLSSVQKGLAAEPWMQDEEYERYTSPTGRLKPPPRPHRAQTDKQRDRARDRETITDALSRSLELDRSSAGVYLDPDREDQRSSAAQPGQRAASDTVSDPTPPQSERVRESQRETERDRERQRERRLLAEAQSKSEPALRPRTGRLKPPPRRDRQRDRDRDRETEIETNARHTGSNEADEALGQDTQRQPEPSSQQHWQEEEQCLDTKPLEMTPQHTPPPRRGRGTERATERRTEGHRAELDRPRSAPTDLTEASKRQARTRPTPPARPASRDNTST